MKTKEIAFITIMGALGNLLFLASFHVLPLAPGISFDFSHTTTFIAALFGGPLVGFISGLFVGLFPGIYYGPLGNSAWLGLIGLPIGKALTGLTCGLLANKLDLHERSHSSLLTIPITLFSYIPECLFTIAYFMILMPYFIGSGGVGSLVFIIPKAWTEIIVISVLMAALIGNLGFKNFIAKFFLAPKFGKRMSKKLT